MGCNITSSTRKFQNVSGRNIGQKEHLWNFEVSFCMFFVFFKYSMGNAFGKRCPCSLNRLLGDC